MDGQVVNLFETLDYKVFVNEKISSMPKKGRGMYRKMAQFLNMSTVMISQIFKGQRDLMPEHAHKLGHFLGLSELEREYFFFLVQMARAGTKELTDFYEKKLQDLRGQSLKLKNIISTDKELTSEEKAEFYSNWYYSGIRLYSSLDGGQKISDLAARFDLPLELVSRVVDFLVVHGLCGRDGDVIKMGVARIHLENDSPLIRARQMDWRLRSFEMMKKKSEEDLFYTAPMSISEKGAKELREEINNLVKRAPKIVTQGRPDHLRCLNIDFFKF